MLQECAKKKKKILVNLVAKIVDFVMMVIAIAINIILVMIVKEAIVVVQKENLYLLYLLR